MKNVNPFIRALIWVSPLWFIVILSNYWRIVASNVPDFIIQVVTFFELPGIILSILFTQNVHGDSLALPINMAFYYLPILGVFMLSKRKKNEHVNNHQTPDVR